MKQLSFFPIELESAYLYADSKRKAFYFIKLYDMGGYYMIAKESGIKDKVLDSRTWTVDTLKKATKLYLKKITQKTSNQGDRVYKKAF